METLTAKMYGTYGRSMAYFNVNGGGVQTSVYSRLHVNEPADALDPLTHLTDLTEYTIRANSRFFESEADVPRHALTMGIGSILSARRIMLIATGEAKAKAIATVLSGKLTTACPASMLNLHSDVTILCDRAAVSLCDEATIAALS